MYNHGMAAEALLNGRYRLISQLGAGGMAVVYKAQDLALGRTVAIKILRPSLAKADEPFLHKFRQEARNVANLQHPNIVTVYDVGQDGNTYYMVMEFIDGQDLKKIIRASAPLPVDRVLHVGIQICAGIGYAHRAGLVHADVKPQNILLTSNDTVKITDFGIAQALSITQPQDKPKVVWGSPHYFSPEQASGEVPTPASDVYAIGIVLFEMLTGQLPYNGSDQNELAMAHIREQVPHVHDLNKNVPSNLDWVINKVMSKDPSARYRTADQLGRILISYQKQLQEAAAPTPASTPLPTAPPLGPAVTQQPGLPQGAPPPVAPSGSSGPVVNPLTARPPGGAASSTAQPVFTPPPVVTPPPPYQPRPAGGGSTPAEPMRPVTGTGPYAPRAPVSTQPPLASSVPPPSPLESTGGSYGYTPNYPLQPLPQRIDPVTIVLGIIALLAVLGLIVLWLIVWSAYTA